MSNWYCAFLMKSLSSLKSMVRDQLWSTTLDFKVGVVARISLITLWANKCSVDIVSVIVIITISIIIIIIVIIAIIVLIRFYALFNLLLSLRRNHHRRHHQQQFRHHFLYYHYHHFSFTITFHHPVIVVASRSVLEFDSLFRTRVIAAVRRWRGKQVEWFRF